MKLHSAAQLMLDLEADYAFSELLEGTTLLVGRPATELDEISMFTLFQEPSPDNYTVLASVSIVLPERYLSHRKFDKWLTKFSKSVLRTQTFGVRLDGDRLSLLCGINKDGSTVERCREALDVVFSVLMTEYQGLDSILKPPPNEYFVPSEQRW